MDVKTFLGSFTVEERQMMTLTRDQPGLIHFAAHISLILVCGYAITAAVPFWWALLPVQGILINALFMLAHECTHATVFRTQRLNKLAGHVAGWALFLPFIWFRYFHFAHHKWTNIPGKDPELGRAKPQTVWQWIVHVSGVPVFISLAGTILRLTWGRETPEFLPEKAQKQAEHEARAMLGFYVIMISLIPFFPVIIWAWLFPLVIGQPFLRLYLLAEHGDCPQVANMFDNTRTTFSNRLVRWLAWNMPYHTEHHVWPNVPFHALPELHQRMRDHLIHTADGYAAFNKDFLARRLQPPVHPDRSSTDQNTKGTP